MGRPANITFRNRTWIVYDTPEQAWHPPFWTQVRDGLWEPQTYNVFDNFLKPEMTYLDMGAWIGPTVLYAAPMAKRAIAVEPDPIAFPVLRQHVESNNLVVELHNEAITRYNGIITLGSGSLGASTTRANPSGAGRQPDWHQTFSVQCHTLVDFIAMHDIEAPLFIKMDIEGGEEDVLKDFELFEDLKPTMYLSLHPFWWKSQDTWETVRKVAGLYDSIYDGSLNQIAVDSNFGSEVLFTDAKY
jgi:FkbM family methyltransferase